MVELVASTAVKEKWSSELGSRNFVFVTMLRLVIDGGRMRCSMGHVSSTFGFNCDPETHHVSGLLARGLRITNLLLVI